MRRADSPLFDLRQDPGRRRLKEAALPWAGIKAGRWPWPAVFVNQLLLRDHLAAIADRASAKTHTTGEDPC